MYKLQPQLKPDTLLLFIYFTAVIIFLLNSDVSLLINVDYIITWLYVIIIVLFILYFYTLVIPQSTSLFDKYLSPCFHTCTVRKNTPYRFLCYVKKINLLQCIP